MSDEPSLPPDPAADGAVQDERWMERIKTGDLVAFEAFVEAHQQRIVGMVAKMLGDPLDAEDIAQQVFVRVWKSAPRWERSAKVSTWLYTITKNLVFDEFRRRKRHPVQSLDRPLASADDARPLQIADPGAKPADTTLLDREMQQAIQEAIDELPEAQRMAVILRRYDDVPYEEIGQILKLSVPAVKSVLFRARTALREKLHRYLES